MEKATAISITSNVTFRLSVVRNWKKSNGSIDRDRELKIGK